MENYREFNNTELEQLVGKVVRHKKTKTTCLIIECNNYYPSSNSYNLLIGGDAGTYTPKDLLEHFEFLDGTPCGVKEEKTFNIMELDVNKKYIMKGFEGVITFNRHTDTWYNTKDLKSLELSKNIIQAQFIEL